MSGRKSNLRVFKLLDASRMNVDITSPVTNIQFLDNIGVQLHFGASGSPVGTFEVQVSADYEQDNQGVVLNAGNWIAVTLDPIPVAAGAADDIYIDLNQLSAPWIRVFYDKTSGDGLLTAHITGKMI